MGRIVLTGDGAARRPAHRGRVLVLVVGCALAYVVGYVLVVRMWGGR